MNSNFSTQQINKNYSQLVKAKEHREAKLIQSGQISKPVMADRVFKQNKTCAGYIATIVWRVEQKFSSKSNWHLSCQKKGGYTIDSRGIIHAFSKGWNIPFGPNNGRYKRVDNNTFIETTEYAGGMVPWSSLKPPHDDLGPSKRLVALWQLEDDLYFFKGVYQQDESTQPSHSTFRLRFTEYDMNTGQMISTPDYW